MTATIVHYRRTYSPNSLYGAGAWVRDPSGLMDYRSAHRKPIGTSGENAIRMMIQRITAEPRPDRRQPRRYDSPLPSMI